MAASQEIEADEHVRDMMWRHGAGNLGLLLAAVGVAAWRTTHRASLTTGLLGAGAVFASTYTAWLGGELVYAHGAGVKLGAKKDASIDRNPPLWSARAPGVLLRDAVGGMGWVLGRLFGRRGERRSSRDRAFGAPPQASAAIQEGVFTAPY